MPSTCCTLSSGLEVGDTNRSKTGRVPSGSLLSRRKTDAGPCLSVQWGPRVTEEGSIRKGKTEQGFWRKQELTRDSSVVGEGCSGGSSGTE